MQETYFVWSFVSEIYMVKKREMKSPGMGAPPRGEGGVPRPAPHCGEGGVPRPDPPRKNDQNRGEVAGQNKGLYLNFLQKRKLMMEQYHNTEHEWTMPNPAYQ